MTTEQETGRDAPGRRATLKPGPKTGTRRLGAPHQSKPRPRPDVESKLSAAERARLDLDGKGSAAAERARTGGARVRTDAPTASPRTRTDVGAKRPVTERVRPAAGTRPGSADAQVRRPAPRRRPARRQRAPFVLLVVGLLCGGLVSLLLLNTMLAKDAITDAKLRDEIAVAKQEKEKIDQNYQFKMQPENLGRLAESQGQHRDWDKVNSYSGDDAPAGQADTGR
ncbi:hypothetical protein [Nonomuraea sp. NPDC050786]|uniref:hypothetical protein n=1 Tax=Nonomuraea sp. NPDC050786 TaxID=3154840 RepID=UPI0033ED16FB